MSWLVYLINPEFKTVKTATLKRVVSLEVVTVEDIDGHNWELLQIINPK